jgi:hypothetical protein
MLKIHLFGLDSPSISIPLPEFHPMESMLKHIDKYLRECVAGELWRQLKGEKKKQR